MTLEPSHSAVEIERLTVRRGGRVVLHGVNATLMAGEVTGVFGRVARASRR
jgi:ABC-2 type transport system ATP-binding protein